MLIPFSLKSRDMCTILRSRRTREDTRAAKVNVFYYLQRPCMERSQSYGIAQRRAAAART